MSNRNIYNLGSCGAIRDYRLDASRVVYTGSRLSKLDADPGDRLSTILANLDVILTDYQDLLERGWIGKNVGGGVELYKGVNTEGIGELRTLKGTSSITVKVVAKGDKNAGEEPKTLIDRLIKKRENGGDDLVSFEVNDAWLDSKLKPLKDDINEGKESNKNTDKEIKLIKQKLKNHDSEILLTKEDLLITKQDVAKNTEEIRDIKNKITNIPGLDPTIKEDIKKNKENIEKHKELILTNSSKIQDNTNKIITNQENIKNNKVDIDKLKEKVTDNTINLNKLSQTIQKNSNDIKENKDNIVKNTTIINNNVQNIQKNKEEIEKLKKEVGGGIGDLTQIKKDIENNRVLINTNTKSILENKREITALKEVMTPLKSKVDKHDTSITSLEGKVDGLKKGFSVLEKKIESNSSDINQNKIEIEKLKNNQGTSSKDLEDLKKKVEANKAGITSLNEKVEVSNNKISTNTQKIDNNSKKISELTSLVNTNKSNITINIGEIQKSKELINQNKIEIDKLKSGSDAYKVDLEKVKKDIENNKNGVLTNSNSIGNIEKHINYLYSKTDTALKEAESKLSGPTQDGIFLIKKDKDQLTWVNSNNSNTGDGNRYIATLEVTNNGLIFSHQVLTTPDREIVWESREVNGYLEYLTKKSVLVDKENIWYNASIRCEEDDRFYSVKIQRASGGKLRLTCLVYRPDTQLFHPLTPRSQTSVYMDIRIYNYKAPKDYSN